MTIYTYGHLADTADATAVSTLIGRYYAAAAASDGTTACSLLVASIAGAAVEDYAKSPGPSYLRGSKTCAEVMSKIFRHSHRELSGMTKVASVRVKGHHALVILNSTALRFAYTQAELEHGVWRVIPFLGSPLP